MNLKWILPSTMIIFYACAVMYLLLDVKWTKLSSKRKLWGTVYSIVFIILNISAQIVLGYGLYGKFYLLLTQLPVFVLFLIISKYKGVKLLFVLLTAVFFSSPVMFITSVLRSFIVPPIWVYLLCYLLMLVIIKRFFKEAFNYMLVFAKNSVFMVFTAIPLLYAIYSYSLTQYQLADIVIDKRYFILNIPLFLVLLFYILLVQIFKMVSERAELKNTQNLVSAQLNAATEQIEQLRAAERQSAIYRHDLRHHMNYLHTCIVQNKLQEASAYIKQTCMDIDSMKVEQYSESEPVNLILSFYAEKARAQGVAMGIHVTAIDFSRFHSTDLCTLLANAFENAIKASSQAEDANLRYVNLRLYEKSGRLCLELRNGYAVAPVLEDGIPVSQKDGHGIGVKSMIHVAEKYEGVYRFSAEGGEFCFQLSM